MVSGAQKSRTFAKVQKRTPSGNVSQHYKRRNRSIAKCAVTKKPLRGIPRMTNSRFKNLTKSKKTISRAYGGYMSHQALKERILQDIVSQNQQ